MAALSGGVHDVFHPGFWCVRAWWYEAPVTRETT
jgi:hypothetical protein